MAKLAGITLFLQASQDIRVGGRMSKAQYQYALQSTDLDELNYWSAVLLDQLRKNPLLRDVTSDQQTGGLQANVVVDRDAAARLGVSPAASTTPSTTPLASGRSRPSTNGTISITSSWKSTRASCSIPTRSTRSSSNRAPARLVPLSAVAKFKTGNTYLSVNHQGQFPAVTLSFNLAPGVSLGQATEAVQDAVDELHMPSSVQGSFQGTAQVFQASLASTPLLVLAALIAVYVVLGMLYESLIHPITILSTLPSAGVGALLALMATSGSLPGLLHRHHSPDGHREEERHHDDRLRPRRGTQ